MKNGYQEAVSDAASLSLFLSQVKLFDELFCKHMVDGDDFTLRLEVHGNKNELLHARVYSDIIKRPDRAQKRIDEKVKNRKT